MADPFVLLVIGAALGLSLGMLGGGGGVLAVPLLVAAGLPVASASASSLVIVGTASAAALVPHQRAGRVNWRVGLIFGSVGVIGALIGARLAQEASETVVLAGLTLLLVLGAATMLRAATRQRVEARATDRSHPVGVAAGTGLAGVGSGSGEPVAQPAVRPSWGRTGVLGSGVGVVTGFFGIGAGFVVVPALVAAMKIPIKVATATALVVIVINSAAALLIRYEDLTSAGVTGGLAAVSALFAVVGARISRRVPGWVLSAVFGSLMVMVAVYTLTKVLPF